MAALVHGANTNKPTPIAAFTWYALDDGKCTSDHGSSTGIGHCPLMTDASDLQAEFELAKGAGVAAVIVWGSNGDVRAGTTDCEAFGRYLDTTLGPVLQETTQPPR